MSIATNAVVLGIGTAFSALLSIPSFINDFRPPKQQTISVRIGAGGSNSSFPGADPGGDCPGVSLYDGNGAKIGSGNGSPRDLNNDSDTLTGIQNDGSQVVEVAGSQTPEYIKLVASGNDAVCVAWIQTTSAAGDFRTWNGATAQACGLPWYPSTAPFPTQAVVYRPPCFWMSADGRFANGFSARLIDYNFPDSAGANATSIQWTKAPETLCRAPARQQFWNGTTLESCIPYYPSGNLPAKNADGTDSNFTQVIEGYKLDCEGPGIPWNGINLNLPTPASVFASDIPVSTVEPDPSAHISIPSGVTLHSSLNLGPLARDVPTTITSLGQEASPTATATATSIPAVRAVEKPVRKSPVLNRRVETRGDNPHDWCDLGKLVISEHPEHSSIEVCGSTTSWGPDFVSVAENMYCDMCNRKVWPLCSRPPYALPAESTGCSSPTGTGVPAAQTLGSRNATTITTHCFDLDAKELRLHGSMRRGVAHGREMVKRYSSVAHWK